MSVCTTVPASCVWHPAPFCALPVHRLCAARPLLPPNCLQVNTDALHFIPSICDSCFTADS